MKKGYYGQAAGVFLSVLFIFFGFISGTAGIPEPETAVLADFGGTAAENSFGVPGWNTVLKDKYTDYRAAGPGGTAITVGSEGAYNYQGVSGAVMFFAAGDRITAVWYNNSDGTLTFSPKISFDDPDRSCMGTAGTWYGMSAVTVPGRSTGESIFEFDAASAGAYGLANVSVNYSNSGVLICDKILLARIPDEPDTGAPSIPAGVTAEPVSDSEIRISWQPSSDGRGVSVYEIFRDGVSAGTSGETSYTGTGLSPLTEYAYTVRACDGAGNCSEQSAAVSAATFGQISVSEAFAETCDDDAYETSDGSVSLTDSVLILGGDGAAGIRFSGTDIPRGAVITAAYIEFEAGSFQTPAASRSAEPRIAAADPSELPVRFAVSVEDSDSAAPFLTESHNISGRTAAASAEWEETRLRAAGEKYRTTDIAPPVRALVTRDGWVRGNAAVFVITGTGGLRYAVSCDGGTGAVLHTEYYLLPDTEPPGIPENLSADPVSNSAVRLCWTPSSGNSAAAGYEVFRDGLSAGTVTELFFEDTGLTPGVTYTYTVEAYDAAGNRSGQSLPVSAVLPRHICRIDVRVNSGNDDAEEKSDCSVSLTEPVLYTGSGSGETVTTGIRFAVADIPQGSMITKAYIEFTARIPGAADSGKGSGTAGETGTSFTVSAEAADSAASFSAENCNISGRPSGTAYVKWEQALPWGGYGKPFLYRIRQNGEGAMILKWKSWQEGGGKPGVLAFDSSGLFGGDLFVCENGSLCLIWRVHMEDSSPTASVFVKGNKSFLKEMGDIAFGPGGYFGTDMYVYDIKQGIIYTLSPDGAASEFAFGLPPNQYNCTTAMTFSHDGQRLFVAVKDVIIEINPSLENQVPRAFMEIRNPEVCPASSGRAIMFEGGESWDMEGNIVAYDWNFGDGTIISGGAEPVLHVFKAPGDYTVSLTVRDAGGATDTKIRELKINSGCPPYVVLTVSGNAAEHGELIFSAAGTYDPDAPESAGLEYEWDFGDGSPPADGKETVAHIYETAGFYTASLTVTDGSGISNRVVRGLRIVPSQGPVAAFSVSGLMTAGEPAVCDGAESYSQEDGASVVRYDWDFGDGNTQSAADTALSHVYAEPGEYTVSLTVTDSTGKTGTAEASLNITADRPPKALFGYSGQMAAGCAVAFDGAASMDPEGHELAYLWNFGDGTEESGPAATHAFASPGDYKVKLTVTDTRNQTGVSEKILHITSPSEIAAAFSVTGVRLTGRKLIFDAAGSASSSGSIVSYTWDFGDGNSAQGSGAVHSYAQPGDYTVTLRITDGSGAYTEARSLLAVGYQADKNPSLKQMICPARGPVGETVSFSAAAEDANGDDLTYLREFGDGNTADGPAVTHIYSSAGVYDVSVTVSDGRDGSAAKTARIEISEPPAENVAPEAEAGGPYQVRIGEPVSFDGSLSYDMNGDPLGYSWSFGGTGAVAAHTFDTPGVHEITLTVTDPAGLTGTDTAEVRISDPSDTSPPAVSLDLGDCPDIYDLYPVPGSVSDESGSVSYRLQSREKGASDWITFAEGTGASFSGELGIFDPTVLRNGVHEIRLYAEDAAGNPASVVLPVIVDGQLKADYAGVTQEDMNVSGPAAVSREYDSRLQGNGDFGPGWSLPSSQVRAAAANAVGEGWTQIAVPGYFGLIPRYYIRETRRHTVVIRFSDTDILRFEPKVYPESDNGPLQYVP